MLICILLFRFLCWFFKYILQRANLSICVMCSGHLVEVVGSRNVGFNGYSKIFFCLICHFYLFYLLPTFEIPSTLNSRNVKEFLKLTDIGQTRNCGLTLGRVLTHFNKTSIDKPTLLFNTTSA